MTSSFKFIYWAFVFISVFFIFYTLSTMGQQVSNPVLSTKIHEWTDEDYRREAEFWEKQIRWFKNNHRKLIMVNHKETVVDDLPTPPVPPSVKKTPDYRRVMMIQPDGTIFIFHMD